MSIYLAFTMHNYVTIMSYRMKANRLNREHFCQISLVNEIRRRSVQNRTEVLYETKKADRKADRAHTKLELGLALPVPEII